MQDRMVPLILQQAAKAEGSTQALASRLHAPEATLLRWMDGRAQTPLRAFLAVLEFLMKLEHKAQEGAPGASNPAPARGAGPDKLVFPLGPLHARCARCDATEFRLLGPGPLLLISRLACTQCGEEVVHGNLLAQLAKDAVQHSRAVAVRTKRAVDRARGVVERGRRRIERSAQKLQRTDKDG